MESQAVFFFVAQLVKGMMVGGLLWDCNDAVTAGCTDVPSGKLTWQ